MHDSPSQWNTMTNRNPSNHLLQSIPTLTLLTLSAQMGHTQVTEWQIAFTVLPLT